MCDAIETGIDMPWRVILEGPILRTLWAFLGGDDVLSLSQSHPELWTEGLGLVPWRLPSRTFFALLSSQERGAALQALPIVEKALLFENFSGAWGHGCFNIPSKGDARGPQFGNWTIGPGTFVPPRMERILAGPERAMGLPQSVWCLTMTNEDVLCDLDPSGLVFSFPTPARPRFAAFRCRIATSKPHRCGGVFALAEGLGNDKGPERAAVFIHFHREPDGRLVHALCWGTSGRESSATLGTWEEDQWSLIRIWFDWDQRMTVCKLNDEESVQVPFNHANSVGRFNSEGCRYLILYNQTCDFRASWTDIVVV